MRDVAHRDGPGDALDLNRIGGGSVDAGRVDDGHGNAVDVDRLGHQIAGGARSRGDDGAARAGEAVEEARLPGVRPAGEHDLQSLADQPSSRRAREHLVELAR